MAPRNAAPAPGPSRPLSVLLVEDSEPLRRRLREMIAGLGEAELVGEHGSVSAGLEGIRAHRPDVVLLDLALPDGSGLEILSSLRRGRGGPLVIVLTNRSEEMYRTRALELGASFFFDKSSQIAELEDTLAALEAAPPQRSDTGSV